MHFRTLLFVFALVFSYQVSYGFHIECPDDVTVDCDDELWDLSIYGTAYVHGYGNPVPASSPPVVNHYLNNCGTGYITRTWTAYDYSNNPHSCTQHIYVEGGGVGNISWPPNYETDNCGANLNPDALPTPYDRPILSSGTCSNLMASYHDEVFDFGGCKKILREWKVIDWCTYNPNDPLWGGMWKKTQIIKIKPSGGSLQLYCPSDIVVSAGAYCNGTYVNIPSVTATGACGGTLNVTHNSPYASNQGNNASGHYPNGVTWITFKVDDPCSGAWKSCQMKVTVVDEKKPTPICYHGITINLMMNADGYYMDLDPKWLDKGSFDNCTPKEYLKFRVEPSRFDCSTLGRQDVRMYVTDADGNEQYCNTYVIVQDNMGMCPPPDTTTFDVSGKIMSISGYPMSGMKVNVSEGQNVLSSSETDDLGHYEITNLMNSGDYMIEPQGDYTYKSGINVLDLLLMAKHVQQISEFEKDYQYVTADVNHDGYVTIKDVVDIKNLLLNRRKELPARVSWKFTTDDYGYDEIIEMAKNQNLESNFYIKDLQQDVSNINFRAIKMGDVDNSLERSNLERQYLQKTIWKSRVNAENPAQMDIVATEEISIQGMQVTLGFTEPHMEALKSGVLNIAGSYTINTEENSVTIVLANTRQSYVQEGEVLFSIELNSNIKNAQNLLQVVNGQEAVVYDEDLVAYRVIINQDGLEDSHADMDATNQSLSVTPNPIGSDRTFTLNATENIMSVSVHTMNGMLLNRFENKTIRNSMSVHLESGEAGQMYLIKTQLESGVVAHNKVLVIE